MTRKRPESIVIKVAEKNLQGDEEEGLAFLKGKRS